MAAGVACSWWPRAARGHAPAALAHYQEARALVGASPWAAAALLHKAAEALVRELLEEMDVGLNEGIGQLVRSGRIRSDVQQACDVLRVTGNEVLHPWAD